MAELCRATPTGGCLAVSTDGYETNSLKDSNRHTRPDI
jgi:hypothetical protein